MAYKISWDNPEKTVVLQQYIEPASKDDLYLLAKESAKMLNSVSHTVHLIVDEHNINHVLSSADMKYLDRLTPANQGAVIVVVDETALKYKEVIQIIGKKIAPKAFDKPFFASTVDEARQFLHDNFDVYNPDNGEVSTER